MTSKKDQQAVAKPEAVAEPKVKIVKRAAKQFVIPTKSAYGSLYGKQVDRNDDTFGKMGLITLALDDENTVDMDAKTVGKRAETLACAAAAVMLSFSGKHRGYANALVVNATDDEQKDSRLLRVPLKKQGTWPCGGIVISLQQSIMMSAIAHEVLEQSLKEFPLDEAAAAEVADDELAEEEVVALY